MSPSEQPILLITRPAAQADESARRAEALGFTALLAPMLSVQSTGAPAWPDISALSGLLVTSRNALLGYDEHGLQPYLALPAYCVGDQSAAMMRAAGFTRVTSASGCAADLVTLVKDQHALTDKALLYLRGAHVHTDLESPLGKAGIAAKSIITYKSQQTDIINKNIIETIESENVRFVSFYSKRAAQNFVQIIDKQGLAQHFAPCCALCLSPDIASALPPQFFSQIRYADHPSEEGMDRLLKLIINQC